MTNLSELNGVLCAVCYTYGDSDALFLHCIGQGVADGDDFYINRDEDPFFISTDWNVEIRKTPEEKKKKVQDAETLTVIRVFSLEVLGQSKMDIMLFDTDSYYLLKGFCQYSDQTLKSIGDKNPIPLIICRDWFPRIRKYKEEEKYGLWLSVGALPLDADEDQFEETGIKLPANE